MHIIPVSNITATDNPPPEASIGAAELARPSKKTPEEYKAAIKAATALARGASKESLHHYKTVGEIILDAKKNILHGQFGPWAESLGISSSWRSLVTQLATGWHYIEPLLQDENNWLYDSYSVECAVNVINEAKEKESIAKGVEPKRKAARNTKPEVEKISLVAAKPKIAVGSSSMQSDPTSINEEPQIATDETHLAPPAAAPFDQDEANELRAELAEARKKLLLTEDELSDAKKKIDVLQRENSELKLRLNDAKRPTIGLSGLASLHKSNASPAILARR